MPIFPYLMQGSPKMSAHNAFTHMHTYWAMTQRKQRHAPGSFLLARLVM